MAMFIADPELDCMVFPADTKIALRLLVKLGMKVWLFISLSYHFLGAGSEKFAALMFTSIFHEF